MYLRALANNKLTIDGQFYALNPINHRDLNMIGTYSQGSWNIIKVQLAKNENNDVSSFRMCKGSLIYFIMGERIVLKRTIS